LAVARRAARVVARLRAAARAHDASTARVAARSLALRRAGWREDDAAILGLLDPALDLEGAAAWAVPRRDLYDAQDAVNAGADLGPLDDKERFGAEALAAGLPVAPRALVLGPGGDAAEWARALREHAPAEFVVKPAGGMSGAGIVFAARAGDAVDVHGRGPATWPDLAAWLGSRAGRLVVERRVRPHPAVAALTGQSGLATLRIITLGGPGREPEIVYAVARLPAGGSLVDNFRLAGGGVTGNLLAGVGRDGRLRRPFRVRPSGFGLERVDDHPDSGVRLTGARVPLWDACRDAALAGAEAFGGVPLIGWDVAPADGGAVVVEGNGGWAATADPDGGLVALRDALRAAARG